MANENVTIGIKTTADNAGAKDTVKSFADISKETAAASKHATQLLSVIAELTKQLDGMDGEAARALRQELADLGDVVNSLDIERLKHLDSILANIAATGERISGDGIEQIAQDLAKVQTEARKFQAAFSNANQVKVDVDVAGLDDLDALQKRIEGTAAANRLIASLQALKEETGAVADESMAAMTEQLDRMIEQAANAGPQSVEQLRSSFASLAEQMDGLTEEQRGWVKSFDFKTISGELDALQDKVGTVASRMKDGGEMINAAASVLQGNLNGVGDMLKALITRTTAWGKAMSAVGIAKASAALGVFMVGMNALVDAAKKVFDYFHGATVEMQKQRILSNRQAAENIEWQLEYAARASQRKAREREIERGVARARVGGLFAARIAEVDLRRRQKLASNPQYNEIGRAEINREADREIQQMQLDQERVGIENAEFDRQEKLRFAQEELARLEAALPKLREAASRAGNIANSAEDPGAFARYFMQLGDNLGLTNFEEEYKEQIKEAANAQQAIENTRWKIAEQIKNLKLDIAELEGGRTTYEESIKGLSRKRQEINAARREEDVQFRYGIEQMRIDRRREMAERERMKAESDEQAELDHQATMQDMQERRAALVERRARRERELAEKERQLAEFTGLNEEDLSDRERQQRQWLEQDVERLRGQIRGDTSSIRSLDRQGDTERYSRQREYYVEQRDEREADRQMLRQWRMSRYGLAGRTASAQAELDLQKSLLAGDRARMEAFIKGVETRSGAKFRYENMTEEEKARFGDLRGDIRMRKEGVRGAQGELFEALRGGEQKDMEFRNSLRESNRLVSLGLAGGGEFQWGKDTAKNTSRMVRLLEEVNTNLKGGAGDIGGVSAQYGY